MYFRLYPTKNNTLFRYHSTNDGLVYDGADINTGANPVMEMMDGKGESKLVFSFEVPAWLKTRLSEFTYKANLQLWDAGTLFQPPIKLKEVTLSSFDEDFTEGDGYSFLKPENLVGVSNWLKRDSVNLWSDVNFTPVRTYHLNNYNEDLNFDVSDSVKDILTADKTPRYALNITDWEFGSLVYTKYIHSSYTKTVFKPYLEFFIDDTVIDKTFNCVAGVPNKIYLNNQSGKDVVGTLTARVTHDGQSEQAVTVVKERLGVYSVTLTPPVPSTIKKTYSVLIWAINGQDIKQQMITIVSPNIFEQEVEQKNLYFYPSTPYTHNIVRQGDVIPFTIVSQIRGKGNVTIDTYEYKITSADGFEMVPWSKASIYRETIYFNVNTEYFYPEQQYEVFIRNKTPEFTITSNQTFKFKLAMNDKSHMRSLSTSPYYSREVYFGK